MLCDLRTIYKRQLLYETFDAVIYTQMISNHQESNLDRIKELKWNISFNLR